MMFLLGALLAPVPSVVALGEEDFFIRHAAKRHLESSWPASLPALCAGALSRDAERRSFCAALAWPPVEGAFFHGLAFWTLYSPPFGPGWSEWHLPDGPTARLILLLGEAGNRRLSAFARSWNLIDGVTRAEAVLGAEHSPLSRDELLAWVGMARKEACKSWKN